jgi:hypothetical protein
MKDASGFISESQDRRETRRYDTVHKIDYKVLVAQGGEGFTQNISEGGFALFLDAEVPPGSVLELNFDQPTKGIHPQRSIVKVMWQKDHIAGVKVLGR